MSDKKTDKKEEGSKVSNSSNATTGVIIDSSDTAVMQTPATDKPSKTESTTPKSDKDSVQSEPVDIEPTRRGLPWFAVFNLILILGLAAAAGYYWQVQQKTSAQAQAAFVALENQVAQKTGTSQIESKLQPLQSAQAALLQRIETLQKHQVELDAASEKLYVLFGRDKNGWQLAEVEYLMRIAQHKLILENDFEGAALTLQAANDRIATTGDLGLLPVRVKISDEIADLKTRRRADLVGMTLKLVQLARQVRGLKAGFQPKVDDFTVLDAPVIENTVQSWQDEVITFLDSLVSIKRDTSSPPSQTEALGINIGDRLEDNLKLTRWSVLERDDFQYRRLMAENIELFQRYYNLDDAANHDFFNQLEALQKAQVKPEQPDINGSLELLKKIISQRDNRDDGLDKAVADEDSNNG